MVGAALVHRPEGTYHAADWLPVIVEESLVVHSRQCVTRNLIHLLLSARYAQRARRALRQSASRLWHTAHLARPSRLGARDWFTNATGLNAVFQTLPGSNFTVKGAAPGLSKMRLCLARRGQCPRAIKRHSH